MNLHDPVQIHDITTFFDKLHKKNAMLTIYMRYSPPVTNVLNESQYPIDSI